MSDFSLTVERVPEGRRVWTFRLHPHPNGVYGDEYFWSCLVTDSGGGVAEISLARAQWDSDSVNPRRLSVSEAKAVYSAVKALGFTKARFERHNLGNSVRVFEREL
jgi:hypothetical protein